MKMNGQSRSFVKQVQVDLLALCDADLFHMIDQWIDGRDPSGPSLDVPEDTRFALGYTYVIAETETPPHLRGDELGEQSERSPVSWDAPSPSQLRTLLTAMDVHMFAQHIIPLAFQSLHPTYPEWYDGVTFNAHLANHLRQIGMKRRTMTKERSIRI